MEALFNEKEVLVTIRGKEYKLKALPLIKFVNILKVLPLDLIAKAMSQENSRLGIAIIAEILQKDAYGFIKATHEATGIDLKTIEDLQLQEFSKIIEAVIEANEESFKMAFDSVKKKTEMQ